MNAGQLSSKIDRAALGVIRQGRSRRQRTACKTRCVAEWSRNLSHEKGTCLHIPRSKGGRELDCIISGTLKRRQKCARPPDVRPYLASIVFVHGSTGIMNSDRRAEVWLRSGSGPAARPGSRKLRRRILFGGLTAENPFRGFTSARFTGKWGPQTS